MLKGTVMKSTGSWYKVLVNGEVVDARIAGKIRLKGLKTTNPISVGDEVEIDKDSRSEDYVIQSVHDRTNYIIRKSTNLSKQYHVIAANLDQAVLVASIVRPKLAFGFIDRFLVNSAAYKVPVVLVINKVDLVDEESAELLDEVVFLYQSIGYQVIATSTETGEGMDELAKLIEGKTTLFSGFSGVGKSTIINQLAPGIAQRTGEVSDYTEKGKHTTTFAEMFVLENGTRIIDTPGIKEMGLIDFEKWELSHQFPEMLKVIPDCKFNNCIHVNEPGCAVKEAVESARIHPLRYQNYLSMLDENFS